MLLFESTIGLVLTMPSSLAFTFAAETHESHASRCGPRFLCTQFAARTAAVCQQVPIDSRADRKCRATPCKNFPNEATPRRDSLTNRVPHSFSGKIRTCSPRIAKIAAGEPAIQLSRRHKCVHPLTALPQNIAHIQQTLTSLSSLDCKSVNKRRRDYKNVR